MKNTIEAKTLRDLSDLLNQVSSATGLTQTQLETQFEDVQVTVYRFENRTLVPPEDFDSIIDIWADSIKKEIRSQSKISARPKKSIVKSKTTRRKASTTKSTKKKAVAPKKTGQKSTAAKAKVAKKSSQKPRKPRSTTSLPLPDNYQSVVSHLYGPSLKRIMPKDQPGQKAFLSAIANESDDGVALLNELSALIAQKYTGKMATTTAYNGLKNKAQVLLGELSGKVKRKVKASSRGQKATTRRRKKRK